MKDKNFASTESIVNQVNELMGQYRILKAENARLKEDLDAKCAELEKSAAEIARLKANYNRLKIAKVYGWNEKSKREANDKISKLVRDIDNCLAELNKLEV